MKLLNTIENYALKVILEDSEDIKSEIEFERLKGFKLINETINSNDELNYQANMYLITGLNEYENNANYKLLYTSIKELVLENRFSELDNVYQSLGKLKEIPKIYKYFFDKMRLEYKITEYNLLVPNCEVEIDDYPNRIKIENSFDLVKEIRVIIKFIKKKCFDNQILEFSYLNSNVEKYYYFIRLLKFYLEILPEIKNIFNFEYLLVSQIC